MMQTLRPDGKPGVYMNDEMYYTLQAFVLETLEHEYELSLPDLISIAEKTLPSRFIIEIGFNLMQIKLDLMARNVIRQENPSEIKGRLPFIALRKKNKSRGDRTNIQQRENKAVTIL